MADSGSNTVVPAPPTPTPLPPPPDSNPLTQDQWETFLAIADAIIPSIVSTASAQSSSVSPVDTRTIPDDDFSAALTKLERVIPRHSGSHAAEQEPTGEVDWRDNATLARAYLAESASSIPRFRDSLLRFLSFSMPQDGRKDLAFVLNLLKFRLPSFYHCY